MFFSPNNKDLFDKYKQQTYRLAFPLGVVITVLYSIVIVDAGSASFYLGMGMALMLAILSVLVWKGARFLIAIELIFYFVVATFFFLLTHLAIVGLLDDGALEPEKLSDYINSLGLWLAVFMIGGFLTLPKKQSRVLTAYIFLGMALMGFNNLWLLASIGQLNNSYLFRWLNPLSGLVIVIVLIQRMGMLQQTQAATDSLTGLMNRRALYSLLEREMERSERYKKTFTIILFDIDNFKNINDTYGHFEGDHVLQGIAGLVVRAIRQTDSIGRWGGEEFLLILPETEIAAAKVFAERILSLIRQTRFGRVSDVTASFGVAAFQSNVKLEDMLHCADRAMYQAKQNGRNQVAVYSIERQNDDSSSGGKIESR